MKRELFVFAGQSNMMGAAVYPPKREPQINNSYEYKHNFRRLGKTTSRFVKAGYPTGEFSYIDLNKAYSDDMMDENGKSKLCDYITNTYFCPAMANLKSEELKALYPFASFSESTAPNGVTLAPFMAEEWEKLGNSCAYAHIAKGGVSIDYFFTDEMKDEYKRRMMCYNEDSGTALSTDISDASRMNGAAEYFFQKCGDFFADAEMTFPSDNLSNKCFFWLQGESDAWMQDIEYKTRLEVLWDELKRIGFTHFFCIRIDFFGSQGIWRVMKAQEDFVLSHPDAYMLTRAASYFTFPDQKEDGWFVVSPDDMYRNCRDSYFGFNNNHINEKGFEVIASCAAQNLYRVLIQNSEPLLEEENICALMPDNIIK